MRNIVIAFVVVLVILPLLIFAGVQFVPDVRGEGGAYFSRGFVFNAYLIVLGFFLTSAAIGPIAAQFVAWHSDREWGVARRHARSRLAGHLRDFLGAYRIFMTVLTDKSQAQHASFFLDQAVVALDQFFDACAIEQLAFNADMHSAAASLRHGLLPVQRGLGATQLQVGCNRSYRAYVGVDAMNKMRAIDEQLPLNKASLILHDPYFDSYGKLFVDFQIDRQLGAGAVSLHRFVAIDRSRIEDDWKQFCDAGPKQGAAADAAVEALAFDEDSQARLHAAFVRSHVEESWIAQTLVKDGY